MTASFYKVYVCISVQRAFISFHSFTNNSGIRRLIQIQAKSPRTRDQSHRRLPLNTHDQTQPAEEGLVADHCGTRRQPSFSPWDLSIKLGLTVVLAAVCMGTMFKSQIPSPSLAPTEQPVTPGVLQLRATNEPGATALSLLKLTEVKTLASVTDHD
jgi:hypothetical protein